MKKTMLVLAAVGFVLSVGGGHAAGQAQRVSGSSSASEQRALLDQYCVTCHNQKLQSGNLALDTVDMTHVPQSADIWEAVIGKLRSSSMPPPGRPRPAKETLDGFATSLETQIDRAAAVAPNPGPSEIFHRLNRTEYRNVIRDLLALDIDVASFLPGDDMGYGFDNIAGILKLSPTLMERYMSAAREISRVAVADPKIPPSAKTIRLKTDLTQHSSADGLSVGTRGGAAIQHLFPVDAEYDFRVEMNNDIFARFTETHQLELSIDGARMKLFEITPPARGTGYAVHGEWAYSFRAPVKAGSHLVGTTFIRKTAAVVESTREPFQRPHSEGDVLSEPYIGAVTITGPFNASPNSESASRKRVMVCQPAGKADETPCATKILMALTRRAYRRPVTDADVKPLLTFYDEGRTSAGFDAGVERALRALLVSPEFLFRIERIPAGAARGSVHRLADLELASRLSFFLWSSVPDEELVDLASRGRLKDPRVLDQQVRRMLADDRSQALSANFAGQWLMLRNLPGMTPNDFIFPDFGEELRQDYRRETELFFDSMLRENRSVLDLLTADYTFLNERLARQYGISGIYGSHYRRVTIADPNRRGLLGQGSVLTVTSYPDRTSPVIRGKWILENLLGTPPPPPPPNVPALKEAAAMTKPQTMRERMEQHRANPVCSSCHSQMDPLGFALENFDATGRWRTRTESFAPIDASAVLPDGRKFEGPTGLRDMILSRPEQFVGTVTTKLLTYALGRGIEYYDEPTIRAITRGAASNHYTFASLVTGIVQSVPFQMKKAADTPVGTAASR